MGTEHAAGAVSAAVLPFQGDRFTGPAGHRINPPFSSSAAEKEENTPSSTVSAVGRGGLENGVTDLSLKIPKTEEWRLVLFSPEGFYQQEGWGLQRGQFQLSQKN